MNNNKAIIITIGDELLMGQTIDTNSAWMAQRLNEKGIEVIRRVAVGDIKKDIVQALDDAKKDAGWIFLTGGLGPTADDITKPLLCDYFGGRLVQDTETLENVKQIFARRNLPLLERNLKQAEVPDNCRVLKNSKGTAPGMWFEKDGVVTVSLPGVPHEMMCIMEEEVLPHLSPETSRIIIHHHMLTAGLGESFVAEKIQDIENTFPSYIKLAYLPSNWILRLRISGSGSNREALASEIQLLSDRIKERIEPYFIAHTDASFEKILHREFVDGGMTLSLAESCTGGYIGHTLTQVEGASHYFIGSIVSYDTSVKESVLKIPKEDIEQHTEVSEVVARQMAERVRNLLKTTIGFGITGWLSPGHRDSGTVWMAISSAEKTVIKKIVIPYDRIRNKEVALQMAMLNIWKFINGKEV